MSSWRWLMIRKTFVTNQTLKRKMATKFTKYQIDEILPLIDIRRETIEADPESADAFETEESLVELKGKVEAGRMDFTEDEKAFLIEELENRINVGYDNFDDEGIRVFPFINSLKNAIEKINSL